MQLVNEQEEIYLIPFSTNRRHTFNRKFLPTMPIFSLTIKPWLPDCLNQNKCNKGSTQLWKHFAKLVVFRLLDFSPFVPNQHSQWFNLATDISYTTLQKAIMTQQIIDSQEDVSFWRRQCPGRPIWCNIWTYHTSLMSSIVLLETSHHLQEMACWSGMIIISRTEKYLFGEAHLDRGWLNILSHLLLNHILLNESESLGLAKNHNL